MLRDYSGRPVNIGDIVLDDSGRAWRIVSDEFAAERIGRGEELRRSARGALRVVPGRYGAPTVVRVYHCFLISSSDITSDRATNERLWWELYNQQVASELGTELRRRGPAF